MKTRTQIFPKIDKNDFIKLKHIYSGSANYDKHETIYRLIIFVSYIDSSLPTLWYPLKSENRFSKGVFQTKNQSRFEIKFYWVNRPKVNFFKAMLR